jgi:hypothetical protein
MALALAACEDPGVDISDFPDSVGAEARQLIVALRSNGTSADVVETIPPGSSLFGVPATLVRVPGGELFIFEFASAAEVDAAVARVPFILATTTFPPGPHFYRGNRVIVLYVGMDAGVISALERLLGPAFAALPRSRTDA